MLHWPPVQEAAANGKTQGLLQPPQWAMSRLKSKPSSAVPLQSLSWPSQTSTPLLLFTHSQPLAMLPSASKKPERQVYWQVPFTQSGVEFGAMQRLKHRPQFAMSVWRSGELSSQSWPPPPVPPAPPAPAP